MPRTNPGLNQFMKKIQGNFTLRTTGGTVFPLPRPRSAPEPWPVIVKAVYLKQVPGVIGVGYIETNRSVAVVDSARPQG
jgi:hypothetical protein